ncbi:MAG: alpha/beta hydrolase [Acidobacteria bacterium]|nr:alpha/beta hydrolase [Acidobacteriota bacterium]
MSFCRLIFVVTLVLTACVQVGAGVPQRHTLTGDIRVHPQVQSSFLSQNRDILVYLPPNYEKHTTKRYPVLYMHDGQNLFDGATSFIPGAEWRVDETAQALITAGQIRPVIIVAIYNTRDRIAEYTPTPDPEYPNGGKADLYARMLVEEVKPFIDRTYRTKPDACNTALAGSSLGGLVSLHISLKYPGTFGRVAVISPSVWWDNRVIVNEVSALPARLPFRIWLDIGTQESTSSIPNVRLLRDTLIGKGWMLNQDLKYLEAEGARHNESAWALRVEPILKFLFGPGSTKLRC